MLIFMTEKYFLKKVLINSKIRRKWLLKNIKSRHDLAKHNFDVTET